jgi:hypothetical protein
MQKHRRFLLAFVSLGIAAAFGPAQAAALESSMTSTQQWNAASFSLTPEASSPPEFGSCIKVTGGTYTDAGCTKTTGESGKAFEWYPAFGGAHPLSNVTFTIALKEATVATLETVGGLIMQCEGETGAGEYTGNKTIGNVVLKFTNCKASGVSCHSAGAAEGTIVTNTLEGVLGVEELAAEPVNYKIGQDLFPVGRSGPMASFTCSGGISLSITGSIISPLVSNAMKFSTQIKTKAAGGKQKPESFVGETPEPLKSKVNEEPAEQAGETMTTIQTSVEKVEVNSVV